MKVVRKGERSPQLRFDDLKSGETFRKVGCNDILMKHDEAGYIYVATGVLSVSVVTQVVVRVPGAFVEGYGEKGGE